MITLLFLELLLLVSSPILFPKLSHWKDTRSLNFILYALCKNYFLAGKMVSFKIEYLLTMVYLGSDFFNHL